MYPLSITLLLPIKHRILIPRYHLPLTRHLLLPSLDCFCVHALLCERIVDGCDDGIDGAKAFALAGFLRGGEAPGDFPARGG